jgi:DNA-binding transcriptional ArsR family regulator
MDEEQHLQAQRQAEICGLFGNPNRLLILWAIGTEERSVSVIAAAIGASLQNTSQHLRLMRDKGILATRREGNTIYYHIEANALVAGCPLLQPTHLSKKAIQIIR